MTAEELMTLGVPAQAPGSITMPDQATISPADLQAAGISPMIAQAMPQQVASQSIDPAALAAMSDPNANASNPVSTQLANPGSSAPASVPAPVQAAATSTDQPQNATASVDAASLPNKNIAQSLGFPQFSDWAKATGLPQNVTLAEREKILDKYLTAQQSFMDKQDPEKILKIQQMQHSVATQATDDQLKQAQIAESNTKVVAGELAKQQAQQTVADQMAGLQTQKDNLDAVINHPALSSMVGGAQQFNPGITDEQRDLKARLEQLQGQGLINGINLIKSEAANPNGTLGMRITQQEALAVQNAAQRLQRFQSPDTFKASAQQLSDFLARSIEAKQKQLASLPAPNPQVMQQGNYTPTAAVSSGASSAAPAAPVTRVIRGVMYQQNPATGGWRPVQ